MAKECDENCGGLTNKKEETPEKCTDPTHAAYHAKQWLRYGYTVHSVNGDNNNFISLHLDEIKLLDNSPSYPAVDQYAQLYVPYDYFEQACKMIKSVYSESNGYAGYFNYMKYWAKNGDFNWICNRSEYKGPTGVAGQPGYIITVNNAYTVTNFWNNYDGTKSPVDNSTANVDGKGHTKAFGWKLTQNN